MQGIAAKLNLAAARVVATVGVVALGFASVHLVWTLASPLASGGGGPARAPDSGSVDPARTGPPIAEVIASLEAHNPWERAVLEPAAPGIPAPAPEVTPGLGLRLIGTMVSSDRDSWAVLTRDDQPAEQLTLRVGDRIDGAVLEGIERSAVYLRSGERLEVVSMATEYVARPRVAGGGSGPETVTLGVSRDHYEAVLSQGASWFKWVNLVPYYQGSETVGYQLKLARHGPAFDQFGIANGDVIRSVNGIPIGDTRQLLRFFAGISSVSRLDIDLLRNGAPRTVQLRIEG